MKDVEAVIDAIFILRQNADSDFEKNLIQDFVEKLLHAPQTIQPTQTKTLYERTCPVCGKKFQTNRVTKKFCSIKCRKQDEYSRHKEITVVCKNCGKIFQASKYFTRQFCSTKCAAEFRFNKK